MQRSHVLSQTTRNQNALASVLGTFSMRHDEVVVGTVRLKEHPFALLRLAPADEERREVYLLADPSDPLKSVNAMIRGLYMILKTRGVNSDTLRIIKVPMIMGDPKAPVVHNIYFEINFGVGIHTATYLCGGCTDGSGMYKHVYDELRGIYSLIQSIYGVPIEEVVYDVADGAPNVADMQRLFYHNAKAAA